MMFAVYLGMLPTVGVLSMPLFDVFVPAQMLVRIRYVHFVVKKGANAV